MICRYVFFVSIHMFYSKKMLLFSISRVVSGRKIWSIVDILGNQKWKCSVFLKIIGKNGNF